MSNKRKILFNGLSLLFVLCIFDYFATYSGLSFVFILAISMLAFFLVVFPYFIIFIDCFGRNYRISFKNLKKDVEYKVIKKEGSSAEVVINKERKNVVKDFVKYAPFINEGDYFVILSFAPLDILWIVRENASEKIDIHI